MDDVQEKLFTLMALAEEQQKSAQSATQELAQTIQTLTAATAALTQLAPILERAAAQAMGQSLADASRIAAASLESAARPILSKFNGMTLQAAVAETKLKGAVTWFTWKWAGLVSASIMCMFIVWCLLAQALLWWHKDEVDQLLVQRAALTRELAQLQAQADVFEARAGRAILTRCGIENRLCVRIDKQAGVFGDERHMVLLGY